MTVSPVVACVRALRAYLQTGLQAIAGLSQSRVIESWPEPTEDLTLADNRVVVAITTPGVPERSMLGAPKFVRKVSDSLLRYDTGAIESEIVLGLWATTKAMRDEVDFELTKLLNRPYWATVSAAISTTLSVAIETVGEQWITPASMSGISPGHVLRVSNTENVVVQAIKPATFKAVTAKTHLANAAIVQQKARRDYASQGLHLAMSAHFGVVARMLFDEPQATDAPGVIQRQEWRSMREGRMFSPYHIEVAGVVQDTVTTTPTWE